MFRMYGRKVEILKYSISYVENDEQKIEYAATEEEANEILEKVNGTIAQLEAEDDIWMDGVEVDDVPDTYNEAIRIYNLGKDKYYFEKNKPTELERLKALESAFLSMLSRGV